MKESQSALKISDLAEGTGVSKELIHHYLRQGLLPRPTSRARYDEQQVRLLHLVKRLREEHHLPLETIRKVFETYDFDPAMLEPLVLADSFSHRLARLAEGELAPTAASSAEEICTAAGITRERLQDYLRLQLAAPLSPDGEPRFSDYDANTIALCERGVGLGISLDAFRTVASHIRVAWQLEHAQFFELAADGDQEPLGQLFLRREIVGRFVQNVLDAMIQRHLERQLMGRGRRDGAPALDQVIYRPSAAFLKRHGIPDLIDRLQDQLVRSEGQAERWLELATVQLHAGRYREAAFVLEQALERWPDTPGFDVSYGAALLAAGEGERAEIVLEGASASPLARVLAAAARLGRPATSLARATKELSEVRRIATAAVQAAVQSAAPEAATVQVLGGWILTALPPALREVERGQDLIRQARSRVEGSQASDHRLPGLRERYLINSAFLLLDSLGPGPGSEEEIDALRTEICLLDPQSTFAERVYLEQGNRSREGGEAESPGALWSARGEER